MPALFTGAALQARRDARAGRRGRRARGRAAAAAAAAAGAYCELNPRPRAAPVVNPNHIAVLDDDPDITQLLATYLGSNGLRVTQLHQGSALLRLLQSDDAPGLVLLDLGLPGEDGLAIARALREQAAIANADPVGLVIITGRGDAVDRVVGLEIGADDYVTKPFDLRELLARIKAVLRRLAPAARSADPPRNGNGSGNADLLRFAGWQLDRAARRLTDGQGREVVLTGGEFDLLCVLAEHAGRVLSRDFLLERTRGREAGPFDRTVDVQIGRLRKKLDDDASEPRLIKSVRGAGYLLATPTK